MFNRMRIYTVHAKPDDTGSRFKPVFVKEGFNIMAFIFTIFWALYQRLWIPAALLLVVNIALVYLAKSHVFTHGSIGALHLGIHVMVGFLANDWVRARLRRQAYVISDITAADNYLRAQQRYLERYVAVSQ